MAMFAMEPPVEFGPEDLRDEKLKVLRAVKPMAPSDVATNVVRGQYVSGWVEGERITVLSRRARRSRRTPRPRPSSR